MGILVGLPRTGGSEKDLQLNFGKVADQQMEVRKPFLPAEWYPQSGVQLTWPHAETDWAYMLEEVQKCFIDIAREIAERELLLIVTPEPEEVKKQIAAIVNMENVRFLECGTNDTWARDHGAITMMDADGPSLLDFTFNGWGLKFASHLDNQVEIEEYLKSVFQVRQILWLDDGYLAGDDTDSHIDTLARFCPADTIVYVQCEDETDEHYEALQAMEEQLHSFRTLNGEPYRLLALPMADKIVEEGERLPATYANFLILNGTILYPTYNQPENDRRACEVLQEAFPGYQMVGIDCRPLIKQHGSLHCVTMQYPLGVLK